MSLQTNLIKIKSKRHLKVKKLHCFNDAFQSAHSVFKRADFIQNTIISWAFFLFLDKNTGIYFFIKLFYEGV